MAYQPLVRIQPQAGSSMTNGAPQSSVPDIPGERVDPRLEEDLRDLVAHLCRARSNRFPGAQPVSFEKQSIDALLNEDYWVCEKTDGQRVLIYIVWNPNTRRQDVFLIDRKNGYRKVRGLLFPGPQGLDKNNPGDPMRLANNTLLDGELVWDTDPTGKRKLRLYLFDAMVVQMENIMYKPLSKRYGRLKAMVYQPFFDYMYNNVPANKAAPFEIKVKHMDLSYAIEGVLKQRIPTLQHGNDGLIFTCLNSTYTSGTDPKILKWKPPSENTIDFKLRLRFPPDATGRGPDLAVKPFFQLDQWIGRQGGGYRNRGREPGTDIEEEYEFFDWLDLSDDEWEQMKASGVQYDDQIVECAWVAGGEVETDSKTGESITRPPRWVLKRIRDDKTDGNHATIVKAIIKSIQDGVEADELITAVPAIRTAWKSQARMDIRDGKTQIPGGDGRLYDPVIGPIRGGPGPPMREGGTIPGLKRR